MHVQQGGTFEDERGGLALDLDQREVAEHVDCADGGRGDACLGGERVHHVLRTHAVLTAGVEVQAHHRAGAGRLALVHLLDRGDFLVPSAGAAVREVDRGGRHLQRVVLRRE